MSTIAAAADRYLDCLHGLARTLTAQASENMVRALVAERDAVVKRAEKAEAEVEQLRIDAERYRYLRERDLETISAGGVFAGMTPRNVVLNGEDLDHAVDAALKGASHG